MLKQLHQICPPAWRFSATLWENWLDEAHPYYLSVREYTYDVWRVMAYLVIICTLSLLHHTKSLECRVCAVLTSQSPQCPESCLLTRHLGGSQTVSYPISAVRCALVMFLAREWTTWSQWGLWGVAWSLLIMWHSKGVVRLNECQCRTVGDLGLSNLCPSASSFS